VGIFRRPKTDPLFRKVRGICKTPPATLVPIGHGGDGPEVNLVWKIFWILPRSTSIPCENWHTAGERLLVRNPLCLVLTEKNHRPTLQECTSKILLPIKSVADFYE